MEFSAVRGRTRAVIDSHGAQLISLKDAQDREYIWNRDPAYWSFCAPVLFPFVGRPRDGRVDVEGRSYDLPKHGFARDYEFSLCGQEEGMLCFQLESREETRRVYPYEFALRVRYLALGNGLTVRYEVDNKNSREMAFCIGAHPAINCPLDEGEQFSDYELRFEHPETAQCPILDENGVICFSQSRDILHGGNVIPLEYSLFNQDALVFEHPRSREVSLISRKSGHGVRFLYSNYPAIAFWTPDGKEAPFLCIEPWFGMGARDDEGSYALEEKKDAVILEPGKTFETEYTMLFL